MNVFNTCKIDSLVFILKMVTSVSRICILIWGVGDYKAVLPVQIFSLKHNPCIGCPFPALAAAAIEILWQNEGHLSTSCLTYLP